MILGGDLTYLGLFLRKICVKGCFFFFFFIYLSYFYLFIFFYFSNVTSLGSFAKFCDFS